MCSRRIRKAVELASFRVIEPDLNESTSDWRYGWNRERKSCLIRCKRAGTYARGSRAGKTT